MTERYLSQARLHPVAFLFTLYSLTSFSPASAQSADADNERLRPAAGYQLLATRVAGPFHYPWSVAFLPDDRMLVTEKNGQLILVTSAGSKEKIAGVPAVWPGAEGGLLDVAVSDDFVQTGTVFLSYTTGKAGHVSVRLMRAHLDIRSRSLTRQQIIFTAAPDGPDNRYLGGRIALAGKFIFLSLGDRGTPARAQRLSDDAGKIIRLQTDGTLPSGNPFAGLAGVRPEIWSYGHRNPEGLVFDRKSGLLWSSEHGPRGGDELNRISAGENYGWPLVSFGKNYDGTPVGSGESRLDGVTDPVWQWTPSAGPSGLALEHTGNATVFWSGALPGRQVSQLTLQSGRGLQEAVYPSPDLQRVRDVRIGPSGALYILTDSDRGGLFRLAWRASR
ncbi:TPA: PQQ-dependent sugar dehydrogenase [Kluyvera ascorbata]|uniref:PQQ-dependent sugar dehydrogenase n=1 Tax=Enterobacteriaceae TaxID=543 RepID=UPI00165DC0D5|nr:MULTISPECIES: PQQ-dependent sugar dehydrogenase [Enterobacteriaceae]MEB8610308.1 PQQ-dependent sugar dehydrogenase [Cronobacter sakazakii]WNU05731.1 PQQ-dependent sugar dehydrogenase [Citrobacter freundii]HAT7516935.1 PQQ-dependent sugar dehydrogenase [Kluyvera ascorbata]